MTTIPAGYVAYGWFTGGQSLSPRSVNMGVRESVVHFAPEEQTRPGASGRVRDPYEGICGRRCRARGATVESPNVLAHEVEMGRRKVCQRCVKLTAEESG